MHISLGLRRFTCQADGYTSDRYLAYCDGSQFGDYEHGAFWFEMDPALVSFAKNADVLFTTGNALAFPELTGF